MDEDATVDFTIVKTSTAPPPVITTITFTTPPTRATIQVIDTVILIAAFTTTPATVMFHQAPAVFVDEASVVLPFVVVGNRPFIETVTSVRVTAVASILVIALTVAVVTFAKSSPIAASAPDVSISTARCILIAITSTATAS